MTVLDVDRSHASRGKQSGRVRPPHDKRSIATPSRQAWHCDRLTTSAALPAADSPSPTFRGAINSEEPLNAPNTLNPQMHNVGEPDILYRTDSCGYLAR
jgi:hypothetical protein